MSSLPAALDAHSLLFDLTPLDTPTRLRGNGRYLRELALGLSELPASTLGGLKLFALTHLERDGRHRITDDLSSFSGSEDLPLPSEKDHYHWAYARRLGLWRALRTLEPGAVHLGDPNATPLMGWATRAKTIVTCHDMVPLVFPRHYLGWKDGGPWVGRAIERRRYRRADRVIAISEATSGDLARLVGVPAARVARVYNGVDVERWSRAPSVSAPEVRARLGLGDGPFALCVGGADWHKNPEGAVAGLAAARRGGVPLSLVWAGRLRAAQREVIERAAEASGVRASVHLLGHIEDDDLAALYRTATAHLLVSRYEGFGLTIVEAMAAGCPVVTTRLGSLLEVAGEAALTVGPEDHEAIGAALARLWREPGLREELSRRGRERAPTFSRVLQARAMVAVYRDVLAC